MKLKLLFVFLFFIGISNVAKASEFDFSDVDITFIINEDGSVEVTECRTYDFDGEFSWADYSLPATFEDIRDISVAEDGRSFSRIDEEEGDPETFYYEVSDEQMYLRWNYEAANESRTFQISYTLEGVIHGNEEWSEFFWEALSDEWDKPTEKISVTLLLPSETDLDSYFWLRSPSANLDTNDENSQFSVRGGPVSRDEFIKVRTVFPSSLLAKAPSDAPEVDPDWSDDQEAAWAESHQRSVERQERYAEIAKIGGYVIIFISLGGVFYGWRNRQKIRRIEPTTAFPDVSPAIASWEVHHRQSSNTMMAASLFDLARRGALTIEEQPSEDTSWFTENTSEFKITPTGIYPDGADESEMMLLEYINKRADEETLLLSNLFEADDNAEFAESWNKKLKETAEHQIPYAAESKSRHHWALGIGFSLVALSLAVLMYGPLLFFITAAAALLLTFSSYFYLHYTPEGLQYYQQIQAYYKGLKKANPSDFSDPQDKIRHLCYAIGFGFADKQMEKFTSDLPQTSFLSIQSASFHTAVTGFSTSVSSSATPVSTAGSAGGGASGGAG